MQKDLGQELSRVGLSPLSTTCTRWDLIDMMGERESGGEGNEMMGVVVGGVCEGGRG